MVVIGVISTLIVLIVLFYLLLKDGADEQARVPLKVGVVTVEKFTIYDEIEALGTANANEAVNITSSSTDKIAKIMFDDGDAVQKGQILVLLVQDEEHSQLQAEQTQLLEHQRELKRLENLLQRNAAAQNEYDGRKTQVAISEHKISEIKARIEDKTIRAPFDGQLGMRRLSVGTLVEPGTVITTLDDTTRIKLDFSVPSMYLDVLKKEGKIRASSDVFENKVVTGTIASINSRIDPTTRSIEVRAIIANKNGLIKPGQLLSVKLIRNEREALVIPEEAILQRKDKHYVYLVDHSNRVKLQEVMVGQRQPGWIEIKEGLQVKDNVILRGISRVFPDERVEIEQMTFDLIDGQIKS